MFQNFQNKKKRNCKTWKKRIVIRTCKNHKKMGTKLETSNTIYIYIYIGNYETGRICLPNVMISSVSWNCKGLGTMS